MQGDVNVLLRGLARLQSIA